MESGVLPAALYSDDGELTEKNQAARSCALFNAANINQLLGGESSGAIEAVERHGFASCFVFPSGADSVRISLIGCEGGVIAIAGEMWGAPVLRGIFLPAAELCGDIVRDSVSGIYYAARSLAEDERDDKLLSIRKHSYRLLRMQENSAVVSGFYSGALKPEFLVCQADEAVRAICETVSMVCLGVPPVAFFSEGDCVTLADRRLLENAVLNLISNSIAYSRAGNEVAVSAVRRGGSILIRVADKGAGIRRDILSKITNPYFSASPYGEDLPRPGLGLGLSVAQAAAQLHGGSMVITSDEARGTAVTLSLPARDIGDSMELHQSSPAGFIHDVFSPVYIQLSGVCEMA